jgi:hypothetical protein
VTVHQRVEHPAVRKAHKLLNNCKEPYAYILLSYRTDHEAGVVVDSNLTNRAILAMLEKILIADRQGLIMETTPAEHEQH